MKLELFNYELPEELIAQHPEVQRDASRMLVLDRSSGCLEHRLSADISDCLEPGDLLVVNNTRVIHARVFASKAATGGKVELLFLEETGPDTWDVLLRASRRPRIGDRLVLFNGSAEAELLEDGELGRARIRVQADRPLLDLLESHGIPPLPPYIKRPSDVSPTEEDLERYQTVFASRPGAVAAPTAGLHFTPELFQRLEKKGIRRAEVTLHVGIGTFRPVSAEQVEDHVMESERYEVSEETAAMIRETKAAGHRVVAVGSTSVRTLETVAAEHGEVVAGAGRSSLYIYPPFRFKVTDAMLTNFHLPKSTLLMMISALAGREKVLEAYRIAVEERYRFFSYGDCMLIV